MKMKGKQSKKEKKNLTRLKKRTHQKKIEVWKVEEENEAEDRDHLKEKQEKRWRKKSQKGEITTKNKWYKWKKKKEKNL